MTEFWDVIGQQDLLISLGGVLSTSWDEDDLTWGWDEDDRVLGGELWLVSRNQLSVLTNDNGDVLEEVVGHHYENENDNDNKNGALPSTQPEYDIKYWLW